jgi:tyrosine decarboxylase/aspartate 1-decarboxylase
MTFPNDGRPLDVVRAALDERREALLDYRRSPALGLAGTAPPRLAVDVLAAFSRRNPNNIGWHLPGEARGPFAASRALESEVIAMLADLVGGTDAGVTGYLAGGGTESNLMALWLARNLLTNREPKPVRVLAARSAHHSVPAACDIVGVGAGRWEPCEHPACSMAAVLDREGATPREPVRHRHRASEDGSGLVLVDLDGAGRMDVADLGRRIEDGLARGIRRYAIIVTVGATGTGAVDPVGAIGALVAGYRRSAPDSRFFIHVDAAMGGLVMPFLPEADRIPFGFELRDPDGAPIVDSMSLDMHKAGLAPYPGGVFLCRPEHRSAVEVDRPYDPGQVDLTIAGSRPGAAAAASWALIVHLGRRGHDGRGGYESITRRSIRLAGEARAALLGMGAEISGEPGLNVVAASFPADRFDARQVREVAARYLLTGLFVSRDESACPERAWRFCFLPHVRRPMLRAALAELAAAAR